MNTKRPKIVFILGPTKPLPSYDQAKQARTGDAVLVREMTGPKHCRVGWGGEEVKTTESKIHGGKDTLLQIHIL